MSVETEFSSLNLGRSKSYDHLPDILDKDVLLPNITKTKRFSRQGAFRRRTQDIDVLLIKRNSMIECKKALKTDLGEFNNEFLMEKVLHSQKKTKPCFASFALVKGMWKSIKSQEKDDIKKKQSDSKNSLNHCGAYLLEIDNIDVRRFLHSTGEIIAEATDHPVLLTESSWEEIVDGSNVMSKTEVDRQAAIWEIIETEANFISQLSIVTNIYNPVLHKLVATYHNELAGVDVNELFGNINEVYLNHSTLWNNCISLPLSVTRIKRSPLDAFLMKNGFCRISKILESYIDFMRGLPMIRKTIRKLQHESNLFKQYIEWSQSYCSAYRDGYLSVLSLPFQRVTRYKLLLERVKSLTQKDQQSELEEMISSIHTFVQQMNSTMVGKYKMEDIKEKIVDANIGRVCFCDANKLVPEDELWFDIMRPLVGFKERLLIHEGRLKLKQGYNKMTDVQCYLCNDLFMMCKPIKSNWDKLKIVKSPIRLDKILIKEESDGCFVIVVYNDFRIVMDAMVFIGGIDEIKLWVDKTNRTLSEFIIRFAEPTHANALPPNCVCEVSMPIHEEDYSSDESQRKHNHSETNSSGYSTYSTDSAFSQASSTSMQTDCCCAISKTVSLKRLNSADRKSIEDLLTIDEEFCNICCKEHHSALSAESPDTAESLDTAGD